MSETTAALSATSMDNKALIQAILNLEDDSEHLVEDPALACALAQLLKPEIDRLTALRSEAGEEGGEELLESLSAAADEPDSRQAEEDDEPDRHDGQGTEDEALARQDAEDAQAAGPARTRRQRARPRPLPRGGHADLLSQPPQDQAHWIFMERFGSLEQHEEILGYTFSAEHLALYQESLARFMEALLSLPRAAAAAQTDDLQALQKSFASQLLFFRSSCIGGADGKPIPCTLQNLRQRYPAYFYKHDPRKPRWYEKYDFYTESLEKPQWVLCDTEHLNCTFRTPERKLASCAKGWNLPPERVRGKTILEDIYDRILCGELTGEDLFAGNHNSCTTTTYRFKKKSAVKKSVFTVQKVHKISLHGKEGIPHWRASRRLWPGVLPAIHLT